MRMFRYFKDSWAIKVGRNLYDNYSDPEYAAGIGYHGNYVKYCNSCPRAKKAGPPVPPMGSINSKQMVVGACPGRQEVEDGIPFNPKAPGGSYLNNYFRVLGWDRTDTYITNACFCLDYFMGKKDRLPTVDEERICSAWKVYEWVFLRQVQTVILLGKNAVRQAFGEDYPSPTVSSGQIETIDLEDRKISVLVLHHPGYLLRRPTLWKEVKESLERYKRYLEVKWGTQNYKTS